MIKKTLLLILSLVAWIVPANGAYTITGDGTGKVNASGTGFTVKFDRGFTSDNPLPGRVKLDSIQLQLTDNKFAQDFDSGDLAMVVFTRPASSSGDWTVVGKSGLLENLSLEQDAYAETLFSFDDLLLDTSLEYVFAFVSDVAVLDGLTIGSSLHAAADVDSPFSEDNGFTLVSMQSSAFYSGNGPGIFYYTSGNETSFYYPNVIAKASDPVLIPEPVTFMLLIPALGGLFVSRRRRA